MNASKFIKMSGDIHYGKLYLHGSYYMEKKIVYLVNVLFLLFDKYIGRPEAVGERVAHAIIGAIHMLYPNGAGCSKSVIDSIRKAWIGKFTVGLMRVLLDKKE